MVEAIIFDVDGTLADTEQQGHRPAFNAAFRQAGLDWHWDSELYRRLLAVTGGKERIRAYARDHDPKFLEAGDADARIAQLHRIKTEQFVARLEAGGIPLRPGVARLLDEARREGRRLAIATTTTARNVEALIENALGHEALTWFEVIAAGDVVAHKKPAPDIYQVCLGRLGLAPARCVAIEDTRNGLLAARGASLTTLITTTPETAEQDFSEAELVLDGLGEPDTPVTVHGARVAVPALASPGAYVTVALLDELLAAAHRAAV